MSEKLDLVAKFETPPLSTYSAASSVSLSPPLRGGLIHTTSEVVREAQVVPQCIELPIRGWILVSRVFCQVSDLLRHYRPANRVVA